jgi:hypothetical protein
MPAWFWCTEPGARNPITCRHDSDVRNRVHGTRNINPAWYSRLFKSMKPVYNLMNSLISIVLFELFVYFSHTQMCMKSCFVLFPLCQWCFAAATTTGSTLCTQTRVVNTFCLIYPLLLHTCTCTYTYTCIQIYVYTHMCVCSHNILMIFQGQSQIFQRFSSSKMVLKTVKSRFAALKYYEISRTSQGK